MKDFEFKLLIGLVAAFLALASIAIALEEHYRPHKLPRVVVFAPTVEIDVFIDPPNPGGPTVQIG